MALIRYRANTGERVYAPKSAVTATFSDPDIIAVAKYLASMR